MNEKQIYSLLGLAARARKIVTGEDLAVDAIRSGKAKLVILSADASDNTRSKISDKSAYYGIPVHEFGTRYELGHAIGKEARVTLAIMDSGFAAKLSSLLEEPEED